MIAVAADQPIETIGTLETWESDSSYPDETPVLADVESAWAHAASRIARWPGVVPEESTPLITSGHAYLQDVQVGRIWMPWAFSPSASTDFAVSSVGMGVMAAGMVLSVGMGGIGGTGVLPAGGVFHLINPGQITIDTTPLWREARAIQLITPGLLPRTFRVRDIGMRLPVTESRTIRALTTITELGDWLNLSHKGVAELCRFSLRASRYWGSGQTENPRPTTVRHLYDVHSFVESLVRRLGVQGARGWLSLPSDLGEPRIDVLSTEQGVKELLREASRVLFAEAPRPERPLPESAMNEPEDVAADPYVPASHRAPPRRPRKPPRR